VTEFVVKVVLSYLLGSIVGGLLVGRLRGGVDIRRLGSGNAGGTNALRTQGKAFAFWVLLIDVGKGWMATRVLAPLVVPGALFGVAIGEPGVHRGLAGMPPGALNVSPPAHDWLDLTQPHVWVAAACGIAVMLGHIYPLWYGFRGGKGVATLVGVVSGLDPGLLVPMLATWLIAVILFGFVGLASMLGAVALAVAADIGGWEPRVPLLTFGVLVAALIIFTHRSNIARMRAGTEPRARRLWIFGLRRRNA
jgi:acyl phosphate:glycerol-3-phosphate acyltransferase